jgi:hypothetical protein
MGKVSYDFTFQLAGGLDIKLKGPISLELVPAEYVATSMHGSVYSSYSAAAGFQLSFK